GLPAHRRRVRGPGAPVGRGPVLRRGHRGVPRRAPGGPRAQRGPPRLQLDERPSPRAAHAGAGSGGDRVSHFLELEEQAQRVRAHAIRMATNGGCFLGASLSCADLLVYLYGRVLRVGPDRLADPDRDYLLLSKGHDVPALYG